MEMLKNRKTAAIIMVVVITVSFFLGGGRQLSAENARAEAIFTEGEYGDGYGIEYDLQQRIDAAYNLKTVAARNLTGAQAGLVDRLLQARQQLIDAEPPSQKAAANRQLSEAAREVHSALEEMLDGDSKDAGYNYRLWADLVSAEDRIERAGYNSAARAFNDLRGALPASLIASVMRIKPLELFA